ncbi:MAG: hypothetical protein ACP5JJ_17055, partial [Anaerolineae bacterium]
LRQDCSTTIVMSESDPEAVSAFADQVVVLAPPVHPGTAADRVQALALEGTPRRVFQQVEHLTRLGVSVPQLAHVAATLNQRLGTEFDFLTVDEAVAALAVHLG